MSQLGIIFQSQTALSCKRGINRLNDSFGKMPFRLMNLTKEVRSCNKSDINHAYTEWQLAHCSDLG
jgi:hypothetical protein